MLIGARHPGFLTLPGTVIAAAKLEMGRVEEALNFLDELQQFAVETHQQMFVSDLHRLRAEALRRRDARDPRVEEEFGRAVRLARTQGSLMLELRAATGFAGWMAAAGRRQEGDRLLKPVYEQMTEGFDTPDLQAASALLGQIG